MMLELQHTLKARNSTVSMERTNLKIEKLIKCFKVKKLVGFIFLGDMLT